VTGRPLVLVTNAQLRSGLAVIRSLGQRRIEVTAADCDRICTGFFSRYTTHRLLHPDPRIDPDGYAERILEELRRRKYALVMPMNDHAMVPLAKRKGEIEKLTRFPYLEYERLSIGHDKSKTVEAARSCGVPVPRSCVSRPNEALPEIGEGFGLPLIVRPCSSSGSRGLFRVATVAELHRRTKEIWAEYGPALIQEYIPWGGMTYDVCVLMNRDALPRAVFVGNRIRTYPVEAGPNVLGRGVDQPVVRDHALRLLSSIEWQGPAQVEFRIDPRDGNPKLMELNPRFWGSLYLGMLSGIDFPYLWYRMAIDGDIEPVMEYRTDIQARWFWPGDILHLLFSKRRLRTLPSWLYGFIDPKTKMYIPSWRDPLPLLGRWLAMGAYAAAPSRRRYVLRRDGQR
jgi:predicted ATP-grasp superfamily ATP-dependent carboligase